MQSPEMVPGGRDVPAAARARHVRATGAAAAVVGGVDGHRGALMITGQARVDETLGEIRISCDQVISWASTVSSLRASNSHGYANPDMTTARWCRCE